MLSKRIKGFYVTSFVDNKRMSLIYDVLFKMVEQLGYLNYTFPCIGLYEDLVKEKKHFEINAEVFKIENKPWFLRPTSEAIAYPIVYGDQAMVLPFRWYSVGPVFRNQTKTTTQNIRSRQITHFFEAHSVFSTEESCLKEFQVLKDKIYHFLNEIGIPCKIFLRPPEDTFPGAVKTYAYDIVAGDKTLQVGTLHYLGDNFSKAYRTNDHLYGLCFGFSERLIGALKSIYGENYRYFYNKYQVLELRDPRVSPLGNFPFVNLKDHTRKTFEYIEKTYDPVFTIKNYQPKFLKVGSGSQMGNLEEVIMHLESKRCELKQNATAEMSALFANIDTSSLGVQLRCST